MTGLKNPKVVLGQRYLVYGTFVLLPIATSSYIHIGTDVGPSRANRLVLITGHYIQTDRQTNGRTDGRTYAVRSVAGKARITMTFVTAFSVDTISRSAAQVDANIAFVNI